MAKKGKYRGKKKRSKSKFDVMREDKKRGVVL